MRNKELIKTFTKRFFVALVIVGAGVTLFIRLPYLRARQIVQNQQKSLEEAGQSLSNIKNRLEEIGDPAQIEIQKIDKARSYAESAQRSSDSVNPISLALPNKIFRPWFSQTAIELVDNVNSILSDEKVKSACSDVSAFTEKTDKLLAYHAAVMKAVTNILDYDPAVDFKQFDLSSEDTKKRLDLAKDGLNRALEQVEEALAGQAAKLYDDQTVGEVETSIRTLQTERDRLEQSGDVNRWKQQFQKEQIKIRANRSNFWQKEFKPLPDQLPETQKQLEYASLLWQQIKL